MADIHVNIQGMPEQKAPQSGSSNLVRRGRFVDPVVKNVFLACAVLIVLVIIGVFLFLGVSGFSLFAQDPAHSGSFFTSAHWQPNPSTKDVGYGVWGFLLGSAVTTALSIIIVTPLAFGMALFMTELCPRWLENILRPLLEIFTGMPSVVIGFLGLQILIPFIARIAAPIAPSRATAGYGWGVAIVVLVIMVLPTVVSVSIDALRSVPGSVREASLALGSTRWQMMRKAIIPAAAAGLGTAVVLGMARAIGETLAVAMVLGGLDKTPSNLFSIGAFFQPNVTATQAIVNYFGDAAPAARSALLLLGFVLLIVSFIFIVISRYLASRSVYK